MSRQKIPYRTSSVVELVAPTNVLTDNPLDFTNDGSTCSAKIYDPAKDEQLTSTEASGQVILSVTNPGKFLVNDAVEVTLDSGVLHSSTVDSIQVTDGTITINTALPSQASAGNRVRVKLGATITMTEYGTPKLETRDWGFRGTILSTHAGLELDLEVDVEISFVGDPGNPGTIDLLDVVNGVIKYNRECEC
jgi:hypothetical protein